MCESAGEKTFVPTEERRRDAATKGDVLRSRELSTAAVMLFGAAWLAIAGPWLLGDMTEALRGGLTFDRHAIDNFSVGSTLISLLLSVLPAQASLAVPIMLLTVASQLGFSDGRWVGANLAFKGSRKWPRTGASFSVLARHDCRYRAIHAPLFDRRNLNHHRGIGI